MTGATPTSLEAWKSYFWDHIETARIARMSDADRDALVDFLKDEIERIYFGPLPEPAHDSAPQDGPWSDIGYRK